MEIIDVMRGMVGYLCVDFEQPGVAPSAIGTCFFVTAFHDEQRSRATSYLVTAKHVSTDLQKFSTAYVRLNAENPSDGAGLVPLHSGWRYHPDPAVDIAVLPWIPVSGAIGSFNSMALNDLIPSELELQNLKHKKFKGVWPPDPGLPLYMIGLLVQHAGTHRNIPTVRVGHLSMVTNDLIGGTLGPSQYHLADLQTYPGHSGAPVWVELGDALYLLGVMVGGYPEKHAIVKKQSGKQFKTEEHVALGISLIAPTEKLFEILMSPDLQQERSLNGPGTVLGAAP